MSDKLSFKVVDRIYEAFSQATQRRQVMMVAEDGTSRGFSLSLATVHDVPVIIIQIDHLRPTMQPAEGVN